LSGFTLGSCIALQYALDYPDEVRGLVLMTVAMRSKRRAPDMLNFRLQAAQDPAVYQQWLTSMSDIMHFIEPAFREALINCHRHVGPRSQYNDLVVIDQFDVQERIAALKPPLLLIRGMDDPLAPEEYEREIHEAVPDSQYIRLSQAGHFPMAERPEAVNEAIQTFIDRL
jgi:pimeloyl-ACP methyl ester carboxylesterase